MTTPWSNELGDFQSHSEYPLASVVFVGVCKVERLLTPNTAEVDKIADIQTVMKTIRSQFDVTVYAFPSQEKWQRTTFVWTYVGLDREQVQTTLDCIVERLEEDSMGETLDVQMEIQAF